MTTLIEMAQRWVIHTSLGFRLRQLQEKLFDLFKIETVFFGLLGVCHALLQSR